MLQLSSKHQDPGSLFFLPLNICHNSSTLLFGGIWWSLCLAPHLLKLSYEKGQIEECLCVIKQGVGFTFLSEWPAYDLINAFNSSKPMFLVHPKFYWNNKVLIADNSCLVWGNSWLNNHKHTAFQLGPSSLPTCFYDNIPSSVHKEERICNNQAPLGSLFSPPSCCSASKY